jgi:cytosine/adenosine deaminase-related metal-dependent hydrolase
MAGKLPPPRRFSDWIQTLVSLKAAWSEEDFSASWLAGAEMLLRTGATTVLNIEALPALVALHWEKTPLRVISFRELIALRDTPETTTLVENAAKALSAFDAHTRVGLSPHAPYTTTTALLQLAGRVAREQCWPLTTHVAESEEEFEMFMYRNGPLFDWLKSQRDMTDCGHGSPVGCLEKAGYLKQNLLAAHVNYLWRDDAAILARRRVSVVHCPRSHDYFRHLRFSLGDLEAAGVNICLGTDSLVSTRKIPGRPLELNMFSEMQALALAHPEVAPAAILKMATLNAARALGRKGQFGEITRHAAADLIVLPFETDFARVYEQVVHHTGDVLASMIGGEWALQPALN